MTELHYIKKSIQLIEEKVRWGNSNVWTHSYFENLSKEIYDETKLSVSYLTLRRFFGKVKSTKDNYSPQLFTKNAIAKYLGYENWSAFVESQEPEEIRESATLSNSTTVNSSIAVSGEKISLLKSSTNFYFFAVMAIAVLLSLLYYFTKGTGRSFSEKIEFKGKNLTGLTPLQCAFFYDVSNSPSKNFNLEADKLHSLPKHGQFYTAYFNLPDFYKVNLLGDGKVLKSLDVLATTKDWEALFINVNENTVRYMPQLSLRNTPGVLSVSAEELFKQVPATNHYWIDYRLVKDFNISGDDFTFESSLKNIQIADGTDCSSVVAEIKGDQSSILIKFVKPGCKENQRIIISETQLTPSYHSLNKLQKDFSKWTKIKITVANKNVNFYYGNELLYHLPYKDTIGQIKRVSLKFKGVGSIDEVKLSNTAGKMIYHEDFNGVAEALSPNN